MSCKSCDLEAQPQLRIFQVSGFEAAGWAILGELGRISVQIRVTSPETDRIRATSGQYRIKVSRSQATGRPSYTGIAPNLVRSSQTWQEIRPKKVSAPLPRHTGFWATSGQRPDAASAPRSILGQPSRRNLFWLGAVIKSKRCSALVCLGRQGLPIHTGPTLRRSVVAPGGRSRSRLSSRTDFLQHMIVGTQVAPRARSLRLPS